MANKRGPPDSVALTKRARVEDAVDEQSIVVSQNAQGKGVVSTIRRTSGLQHPIMILQGHTAECLDSRFDPTGEHIASTSKDRTICLWNVYGACENYGVLRSPSSKAVFTTVQFSPLTTSKHLFAGSSDGTISTFDLNTGSVVRRHRSAANRVLNSVDCVKGTGRELLLSAGDDGTARIWNVESKDPIEEIELGYPITSAKWSADGQQVFLGGLDNAIHCYDLRKRAIAYSLMGHTDTIAGMSVSPNGSQLLSSSFDNTAKIWDIRPFAPTVSTTPGQSPRLYRTLMGAPAGFDSQLRKPCWDPSGDRCALGGADRTVTIWQVESAQIQYKLPGHKGTVIACEFSPDPAQPILLSTGIDGQIYLGEIEPQPRL